MLKIFYLLQPFIENTEREISVREYAKERIVSPPTASKILKAFHTENILIKRKLGVYYFFKANKENFVFDDLSKTYKKIKQK